MEREKNTKNVLTSIFVLLFYLYVSIFSTGFLYLFNIDYNNLDNIYKVLYSIGIELFVTFTIILIYKEDLKVGFKDFIKNNIKYFKQYIKYWFLMLVLMMGSNIIITLFTTTATSTNQEIIINELTQFPIYTFIVTVLIAPIQEELVFRLSFRKMFKNDFIFIALSGLIFGFMHVITSLDNIVNILFIIPYSIPGIIFAYCLKKSKNICVPISLHFIHNGIMMSLQFLLLFLK